MDREITFQEFFGVSRDIFQSINLSLNSFFELAENAQKGANKKKKQGANKKKQGANKKNTITYTNSPASCCKTTAHLLRVAQNSRFRLCHHMTQQDLCDSDACDI